MSSFLDPLRSIIHGLSPSNTQDEILEALNSAKAHAAEARELVHLVEQVAIEWIQANRKDLIASETVRYYVGKEKKDRVSEPLASVCAEILESTGGDLNAFAESLASNPFKFGAAKKILQDKYLKFFTTETVLDLKTGKPLKSLKRSDDRFNNA